MDESSATEDDAPSRLTRRKFLATGASTAAGVALSRHAASLVEKAVSLEPSTAAGLKEIEHVNFRSDRHSPRDRRCACRRTSGPTW